MSFCGDLQTSISSDSYLGMRGPRIWAMSALSSSAASTPRKRQNNELRLRCSTVRSQGVFLSFPYMHLPPAPPSNSSQSLSHPLRLHLNAFPHRSWWHSSKPALVSQPDFEYSVTKISTTARPWKQKCLLQNIKHVQTKQILGNTACSHCISA